MTIKEIQKIKRLEDLEGRYYTIPEDVYKWVPIENRKKQGLTIKRVIGIGISIVIMVGTVMELTKPDVQAEYVFSTIPLFIIAIAIMAFCVSGNLYVDKDSKIVEGVVKKVEEHRIYVGLRRGRLYIYTLYIPSLGREIQATLQKKASVGTYVLLVRTEHSRFSIQMSEYYSSKRASENE